MRDRAAVRDAASLILVRRDGGCSHVLMGQRGAAAAFMPDMFVFPGGALDRADLAMARARPPLSPQIAEALALDAQADAALALPFTAIRELWEETGLRLGCADPSAASQADIAGPEWRGFLDAGIWPGADALSFVFRAVTPPGRPRRFDARFFMADAKAVVGDPCDFSGADAELENLQWIDVAAARRLPVPFITGVVLAEIDALLSGVAATRRARPYFRHDERGSHFSMI